MAKGRPVAAVGRAVGWRRAAAAAAATPAGYGPRTRAARVKAAPLRAAADSVAGTAAAAEDETSEPFSVHHLPLQGHARAQDHLPLAVTTVGVAFLVIILAVALLT